MIDTKAFENITRALGAQLTAFDGGQLPMAEGAASAALALVKALRAQAAADKAATKAAAKAEPAKAEPAKAEPAKAEPAKAEPAKAGRKRKHSTAEGG